MTPTVAMRNRIFAGLIVQVVLAGAAAVIAPGRLAGATGASVVALGCVAGIALFLVLNGASALPKHAGEMPLAPSFALQALALSVVAVSEEVLWRGVAYSLLIPRGALVAIVITTIGFAAMHAFGQLGRGVRTHAATGAVFGLLRFLSSSLVACAVAHVAYNALVLVASATASRRRSAALAPDAR